MIATQETLNSLRKAMKLNIYEAKIWTALLSKGISTAGQLADSSGVPRSRCYDVLEGLEKKGFVMMKIGKPIKYIANGPEEVINTIRKNTIKEENRLLDQFNSIRNTEIFNELQRLYTTGVNYVNSEDISSSIKGRQNINIFMKDMYSRGNYISIHSTEKSLKRKLKVLKKAGCKGNITVNAPVKKVDFRNAVVNNKKSLLRLVNVDDEILLFTSKEDAEPEKENAIWMKSKFVADTIKEFIS